MKQQKLSLQRGNKHPIEISVSKTLRNQLKIDCVKFVSKTKVIPCRMSANELLKIETIDWGKYPPKFEKIKIYVPSAQYVDTIRKRLAAYNCLNRKNKNEKTK